MQERKLIKYKRSTLHKLKYFTALPLMALAYILAIGNSPLSATPLPVTHVSGILNTNTTWTAGNVYLVDSSSTVASGVTLTINAGTIVKINGTSNGGIRVESGATLAVDGTAANPVVFTSSQDDSQGGDSTGNGVSSGSLGDHSSDLIGGGTISISHASFQFASTAIDTTGSYDNYNDGSLTISDSTFSNIDQHAIYHQSGTISLERNSFDLHDGSGSNAVQAYGLSNLSGIVLSGTDENTFSGSRTKGRAVDVGGVVPVSAIWNVDPGTSGVLLESETQNINGTMNIGSGVVYSMTNNTGFNVEDGGTLNVASGTIIKTKANPYTSPVAIRTFEGGTLNVDGTSSSPVVFTSDEDDSIGGDTTNDGSTTGSVGDYGNAIISDGGIIAIAHSVFTYASTAIETGGHNADGSLTVSDSSFAHIYNHAIQHVSGTLSLRRNTFNLQDGSGRNAAVQAYGLTDLTGIVLAGANKNMFNGSRIDVSGNVPDATTWSIDAASGAMLAPEMMNVYGTLNLSSSVTINTSSGNGIIIEDGGEVNIPAGAVYKVAANSYSPGNGFVVQAGGVLNVNGSSGNPVVFTSSEDDTIGGDSTSDGPTTGTLGEYTAAIENEGGQVSVDYATMRWGYIGLMQGNNGGQSKFEHTTIDHVNTALEVLSGTTVYRGAIHNAVKGIYACDWGTPGCGVDAAYVDWGDADGPVGTGSGGANLVCGKVTFSPWLYGGSSHYGAGLFGLGNCGSGNTPSQNLDAAVIAYQEALEPYETSCSGGLSSACDFADTEYACLDSAVGLASPDAPFDIPAADTKSHVSTFGDNVSASATTFVTNEESQEALDYQSEALNGAFEVVDTYADLYSAFHSCTP